MQKHITGAGELLRRIDRFCADADYTTEELREMLIEDGINPGETLRKIKEQIAPLYKFKDKPDGQNN